MGNYDGFAVEYDQTVRRHAPVIELAYEFVLRELGDVLNKTVCDLGCGQGELSRRISQLGAARITAIDSSGELLDIARSQSSAPSILWVHDDAQTLKTIPDGQFNFIVANLMLMDVPHFDHVFRSAFRVLAHSGRMIWTVTHPCFQSPHSVPVPNEQGQLTNRLIKNYQTQHWKSGGTGTIRGTLGANHRPISEYLNGFIDAGFNLARIVEPTVSSDLTLEPNERIHQNLPPILGVIGVKN